MDKIIPIDITEIIKDAMAHKQDTIYGYYGMKESDFESIWKEMLYDMLKAKAKNDVLDKWFKTEVPMNEIRLRVVAYSKADEMFNKMMD
jgi:hypothetical protein